MEMEKQMSGEAGGRRPRSKRYGDKIRRVLSAIRGHKRRHRISDVSDHDTSNHHNDTDETVQRHDSGGSVRVVRKKSRSNSAILATAAASTHLTYPEDLTKLWPGAYITGNKINLYMPEDERSERNDFIVTVPDLMSLETGARDMVTSKASVSFDCPADDISEIKSRHVSSSSRRHSSLSNPDLLRPRNRRPLVDVNDTNDEIAIEAVRNSRTSRQRNRQSLLPVTWTFNELRMDPQQLKLTQFRLGEGSYGRVMLGHYRGQRVAVKRILRQTRHDLEQELRMMHYLSDLDCTPSLVACDLSQEPFTVLTSYHGKSIFDCMGDSALSKQLDWSQILVDTVAALCRIHDLGVVHGDMKEDNVLLDNYNNRIKPIIIDFGLACFREQARPMNVGPSEKDRRKFMEKYPRVAPELITYNLAPDFSTDAYAVGYMIQRVLKHVKVKRPAKFHKVAIKLLEKDLKFRISLHEALKMLQ